VVAVDVDDGDEVLDVGPRAGEAVAEVEAQQLLLRWIEPEARRVEWIVATTRRFHGYYYDLSNSVIVVVGETEMIFFPFFPYKNCMVSLTLPASLLVQPHAPLRVFIEGPMVN
jgi:hypothetical protein